jgi:carboxyl-terminal processing protease
VVAKIHGAPGTKVALKTERGVVTVTRAEVSTPNLFADVLSGGAGYVYFNEFRDKDTELAFEKAVRELRAKGAARLVIDVRGNPGGSLNTAVKIAALFLSKGQPIVSTQDRKGTEKIAYAPADGPFRGLPVKILVDAQSASASEILAGALQDHRRARVVGSRTFGKGSAQALIPLKDAGVIKLTINKWYTPAGRSIQGVGITPDDPVPVTDQDEARVMGKILSRLLGAGDGPPVEDRALAKALE